jgi:hypothetical protein
VKLKLWRRERVHRVHIGDRITLRRWHDDLGPVRINGIEFRHHRGGSGEITITCSAMEHLRIPAPERRRFAWAEEDGPKRGGPVKLLIERLGIAGVAQLAMILAAIALSILALVGTNLGWFQ